ncbi:unnamed protein product [Amoebophrya sp. A25]|nr:unnamed protein product [Amoebophrya sp. A25]|eukprot:GSA25T00014603001.1
MLRSTLFGGPPQDPAEVAAAQARSQLQQADARLEAAEASAASENEQLRDLVENRFARRREAFARLGSEVHRGAAALEENAQELQRRVGIAARTKEKLAVALDRASWTLGVAEAHATEMEKRLKTAKEQTESPAPTQTQMN